MKHRVVLTALFILSLLCMSTYAATQQSAEQVVREAVQQATAKLNAEKDQLKAHPNRIYDLIQAMVVPHFNFPLIARLVLGRSTWDGATAQQKKEFIHEFTTLLVRTYAKALQEYSDQNVVFLPVKNSPDSKLVEIKTEVTGKTSSKKTPINYRMYYSDGNWKVLDLVVDGISLVNSYRGEYASIVRQDGLDGLIAKMKAKNAGPTTPQ